MSAQDGASTHNTLLGLGLSQGGVSGGFLVGGTTVVSVRTVACVSACNFGHASCLLLVACCGVAAGVKTAGVVGCLIVCSRSMCATRKHATAAVGSSLACTLLRWLCKVSVRNVQHSYLCVSVQAVGWTSVSGIFTVLAACSTGVFWFGPSQ